MSADDLVTILFWGAIILFAILQNAAQQKKQRERQRRSGGGGFEFPEVDEVEEWADVEGAEGMVPAEIWEEISGLARGEEREPEGLEPVEAPPVPPPDRSAPERPVAWEDGVDKGGAPPARSELLGQLSGERLRRAFILHEVLGPPVSKRGRGRGGR